MRALRHLLARAEVQTDLLQIVKVVVAAVLAWVLAAYWLDLTHAFLAPWAAMLTVHGTLSRTFHSAVETGAATLVGVLVAWAVTETLGYDALALALALLAGMCLSRLPVLRVEGVTAATTALFVITTGASGGGVMLAQRLGDTLLGVGVGVAVNLLVLPPLDDHLADRQLDDVRSRLSGLLLHMADNLSTPVGQEHVDDWIDRTRSLERSLQRAADLLSWTTEAQAWNPRRRRSARASDAGLAGKRLAAFESAVPQARAIARAVGASVVAADAWDPRFREPWLALLAETGRRVGDPGRDLADLRGRTSELARELSVDDLPALLWPTYGALLGSLRLLLEGLEDPQPA